MKKILPLVLIISIMSLGISGCAQRVSVAKVEKERVDQQISGNKGFISGSIPPEDQPKQRSQTRTIYQVTMEVPPYAEWKNFRDSEKTIDKDIWGNRGYIYGGPQAISHDDDMRSEDMQSEEDIILPDETSYTKTEEVIEDAPFIEEPVKEEVSYKMYKVQQGDTLQKVSQKMYGTTKQWKKIYDFNKDNLKNPDKIYPGQKIKIPEL
jgi:nucleoid-associated protein YgaU